MTDEVSEAVFAELVRYSRERYQEAFANQRLDDVLIGAAVAGSVRAGYLLIGVNSDGTNHHVRFEHPKDQSRIVFRLSHLTEDLAVARVRGHLGSVVLGYGRPVVDAAATWRAIAANNANVFAPGGEPGTVGFDADLAAGYLYAEVLLIMDLDRYIGPDLRVDLPVFASHLDGVVACLRRCLDGRLGDSKPPAAQRGAHRRDLDEARDEILIGHVIADMADAGHSVIDIAADSEYQRVRFQLAKDTLHAVVVALDRSTDRFSSTRRQATVTVQAEVKRRAPRPADLIAAWKADTEKHTGANGPRVDRKGDCVFATIRKSVALADPLGGEQRELSRCVLDTIAELRTILDPFATDGRSR